MQIVGVRGSVEGWAAGPASTGRSRAHRPADPVELGSGVRALQVRPHLVRVRGRPTVHGHESRGASSTTPRRPGCWDRAAVVSSIRNETLGDLDRARRREAADAREGWRPLEVNVSFDDAPIRVVGGREIRLHGLIHRIDEHAGGRQRALSFFTGRSLPDVRGFVNGSSFLSVVALSALTQRGVPIAQAEVEHRSVTHRGNFESQTLRGEALTGAGRARCAQRRRTSAGRVGDPIADQLEGRALHRLSRQSQRATRPKLRARCPVESRPVRPTSVSATSTSRVRMLILVRPLETLRRQRV